MPYCPDVHIEPWNGLLILVWGQQTFYDEKRIMRTFETEQEAVAWLAANHPTLHLVKDTTFQPNLFH